MLIRNKYGRSYDVQLIKKVEVDLFVRILLSCFLIIMYILKSKQSNFWG